MSKLSKQGENTTGNSKARQAQLDKELSNKKVPLEHPKGFLTA